MKIVDANVLLYAVNSESTQHRPAHAWLTQALQGGQLLGLPWVSLLAFIRLSTNPRVFPAPLSVSQAMDAVDIWLASRSAVTVEPTTRHLRVLRGLLQEAGAGGNLTTDAHLAALCIEHGAAVATFDRDFARFGVRVVVPGS